MKQKTKQSGFTLIEVLLVMSIISLISSSVFVSVSKARIRARDARRTGDVRNIIQALTTYYNDTGHFPCHGFTESTGDTNFLLPLWEKSEYLTGRPQDPFVRNTGYSFYAYSSYKATPGGPCGQIFFFEFTTESPATCPVLTQTFPSIYSHGGSHCHMFYPNFLPAPCADPLYQADPTSCGALADGNDY